MLRYLMLGLLAAGLLGQAYAEEPPKEGPRDKNSPSAVVERVQSAFLEVMKDGKKLGHAGRVEKLTPVVMETHDFATFGHAALRRHWDTLTEEQRKAFIQAFADLGIATYAAIFDELTGDRFKIVSEKPTEGGQTLVHTIYTTDGSGAVQFDYELKKDGETWRIVNLIADGVSVLALKRAEFTSVVDKEGFEALMRKIGEQTKEKKAGAKQ